MPKSSTRAKLGFSFALLALALVAIAQVGATETINAVTSVKTNSPSSHRTFQECLLPAIKRGGFQMADSMLWCASVIKVGETYHMFASRWPAQYGMAGWTTYSECVRATATNLVGPYTFQEVVLQKRSGFWDKARVHNVKIVKAGSKFVLFYISTANQTGYAEADQITGPWKRSDKALMAFSNPAPFVRPDLSIYCFGRKRDSDGVNRALACTAPTYRGPYTIVKNGENLLPGGGELEDPTIWWANGCYHVLLNDWKGHATGTSKAGAEYYSTDGLTYHLVSSTPVFTRAIVYDDGSTETFQRRERPFVYVDEKGKALALFTACLPESGPSRVVVQPVQEYSATCGAE